ncbi:MAG: hypothetical protein WED07_00510 [Candidatus Freyarchaeum deiterrae]
MNSGKTKSRTSSYTQFGWAKALKEIEPKKTKEIDNLCEEVSERIRKGRLIKWSIVLGDLVVITLLITLSLYLFVANTVTSETFSAVGGLSFNISLSNLSTATRLGIVTSVIALELSVSTFLSSYHFRFMGIRFNLSSGSIITREDANEIVGANVPTDIMNNILADVEEKTSGTNKWVAIVGAFGVFLVVILPFIISYS